MQRHVWVPVLASLGLTACATTAPTPAAPPPVVSAPVAPGLTGDDLAGSWGLAAYHKEEDRARTIAQARSQCGHPYVIGRGPSGGMLMHLADAKEPVELRSKLGPDGRRFIGTEGPAGDSGDREVVSFDRQVLILRWVDQEVASRYGLMVYVRCGPRAPRVSSTRPSRS